MVFWLLNPSETLQTKNKLLDYPVIPEANSAAAVSTDMDSLNVGRRVVQVWADRVWFPLHRGILKPYLLLQPVTSCFGAQGPERCRILADFSISLALSSVS
jgi:hypothetical protein